MQDTVALILTGAMGIVGYILSARQPAGLEEPGAQGGTILTPLGLFPPSL